MDRTYHNLFARLLLPKASPMLIDEVNEMIDRPSRVYGPNHQEHMHDQRAVVLLALGRGRDGGMAAWLHQRLDHDHTLQERFKRVAAIQVLLGKIDPPDYMASQTVRRRQFRERGQGDHGGGDNVNL